MSPDAEGWVPVARLEDLDGRGRTTVTVGATEVALFKVGDRVYAIKNRCPHRDGPLIRGFLEDGPAIRCPMHGWRFDLGTGASDMPATARVYPVRLDGGQILIQP